MTHEPTKLVLVVPVYNEAARLRPEQFLAWCAAMPDAMILFVNDGSRDGTPGILEAMRVARPAQVEILSLEQNAGKAEAVRRGFLHALETRRPSFVGFWDADLATPLAAAGDLLAVFADRPELALVMGARVQLLGRRIVRQPARHYLGRIFATFVSLTLRLPVYDTQCGAKLFRVTPWLHDVFAQPFSSRWIFDVEIIARLRAFLPALERAILEYPLLEWEDVKGSKVKSGDFLKAAKELAVIAARYRS